MIGKASAPTRPEPNLKGKETQSVDATKGKHKVGKDKSIAKNQAQPDIASSSSAGAYDPASGYVAPTTKALSKGDQAASGAQAGAQADAPMVLKLAPRTG